MVDQEQNEAQPQPETKTAAAELEEQKLEEQMETEAVEAALARELAELKEQAEVWQQKAEEYLDGWQRARAEFANYKKRIDRDQAQMRENVTAGVIRRYLDVLDDLERALKNRPEEGVGADWAAGIELIYRKLAAILESEGVKRMKVDGQSFDPNLHEAISHEPHDGLESGQIIEVVKQGYLIGDRVLRPAMVRVAR